MQNDFKSYEIAFLIKDPEEESAITGLINRYKGNIFHKSSLKEMKLAYPIKKHLSAYFGYVQFELLPADVDKLSQSLKLNPAILRYLTIVSPVVQPVVEKKPVDQKEIGTVPESRSILTNKALEEKLEEILK